LSEPEETKERLMVWYAAHLVLYFRYKGKRPQKRFLIWENIVLVHAKSEEEAFARAEERGRSDAAADDTLRIDKEPVELVFAGVRKLVKCEDEDRRPADGTEVSYTEMQVPSEEAIRKLVAGEPVSVRIVDTLPDEESAAEATGVRPLAKRTG
jgi:hypothetical protein